MNSTATGLPSDLGRGLCRPEGTLEFKYRSDQLFDPEAGRGRILDQVAGRHVFRLERDERMRLLFLHSSPGTGTRIATIEMSKLDRAAGIHVFLLWAPDSTKLVVGPVPPGSLVEAEGVRSPTQLIVGRSGEVFEVGDVGVSVGSFRAYAGDQLVAEPAAIDAWHDTIRAVKVMRGGRSDEGFMFEVIQANAIVVMLVTGLETYAEKRFVEVAGEGIPPDLETLRIDFPRLGGESTPGAPAVGDESVLDPYVGRPGINFQNYEELKQAFRSAYGIRISALAPLSSDDVRDLKSVIRLRHQVIHVSPLQAIRAGLGTGNLEFTNQDYADEAISLVERFVSALHQATLTLRPPEGQMPTAP